jgi:hypothetical protein
VSEMRRKLEAVDQALSALRSKIDYTGAPEWVREKLSNVETAVRKAIETCAREDKARHVRQQRGGSDE